MAVPLLSFFFLLLLPMMLSADPSSERSALLSFKSEILNADGALSSWNDSTLFCSWHGIKCDDSAQPSVTELSLPGLHLSGKLSPSISNLVSLRKLDLSNNQIEGSIPAEFGKLSALQILDLSSNPLSGEIPSSLGNCSELLVLRLWNNSLVGSIPPEISRCSKLLNLSFAQNQLSGEIPAELGSMKNLTFLQLAANNLSGSIPSSLGELTSLRILDLPQNSLSGKIPPEVGNLSNLIHLRLFENQLSGGLPPHLGNLSKLEYLYLYRNQLDGEIPDEIGGARSLKVFDVYDNKLSGRLPSSLYNISSLVVLQVGFNLLSGPLPSDLGRNLPNLQNLHLFGNQFVGSISPFISNCTSLQYLELAQNRLTGIIPSEIGKLRSLVKIDLSDNYLQAEGEQDWAFIRSLANCSYLTNLELYNNSLGGVLPFDLTYLSSNLTVLRMEKNKIGGTIPPGWERFVNLEMLRLGVNRLGGEIPHSIGKLKSLNELLLEENELSGEIPPSLGNLSGLTVLSLGGNQLRGKIPPSLGNLKKLLNLNLSSNALEGEIPREIFSLVSLAIDLDLSGNDLQGPLWPEVGKLTNLKALNLSRNRLSGKIPSSIGDLEVLEYLLLEDNQFQGVIPPEIAKLVGLVELDLSGNKMTGEVPEFLADLRLKRLNLSNNDFKGEVPGIFDNTTGIISLSGNAHLCSDNALLLLRQCRRRTNSTAIKIAVPIAAVLFIFILTTIIVLYLCRNRKSASALPSNANYGGVSYEELRKCTREFSSDNIIGRGAHGSVYSGTLWKNKIPVAVKVINPESAVAAKSFTAEFMTMRNIRHRNLVNILASFAGADQNGDDFMALVYELITNGSLDQWIHPGLPIPRPERFQNKNRRLGISQRLSIAIDVAYAVEYLHRSINVPIIHGDLKPENVLLDDELTARVGDFGLARFLNSGASHFSNSTVGLKGTIGYVAPELANLGKASPASDVYSFGILLLELFTGKRPTDEMFLGGLTLRSYVETSLPQRAVHVADSSLVREEDKEEESVIRCLVSVFRLGLLCSEESEKDRPRISDAGAALTLTRDALNQSKDALLVVHVEK